MIQNQQAEKIRLKLAQRCSSSLYDICKVLNYRDVNKDTHGKIISILESKGKRKLICVPRGCLKSSIACIAYPIYLLSTNPNLRILLDSQLYTNSKNYLREIRAHLESNELSWLYGTWKSDTWNESEIIIKQRTKPFKEASITVGGVGTTKVGQHYDVIIGDDYNSPDNSNTPDKCMQVVDHYKYNLSILEPGGTYVIIGTRYAALDILGYLLDNEPTVLF